MRKFVFTSKLPICRTPKLAYFAAAAARAAATTCAKQLDITTFEHERKLRAQKKKILTLVERMRALAMAINEHRCAQMLWRSLALAYARVKRRALRLRFDVRQKKKSIFDDVSSVYKHLSTLFTCKYFRVHANERTCSTNYFNKNCRFVFTMLTCSSFGVK